jgi:hypothetical protein
MNSRISDNSDRFHGDLRPASLMLLLMAVHLSIMLRVTSKLFTNNLVVHDGLLS